MAKLNILLGRSGVGKTSTMLEKIKQDSGGMRHIILTPDQNTHELERKLCAHCGNTISMRAEVITFSRLCQQVFFHCGGLHDPELDQVGRMVLLHRSVTRSQKHLDVLSKYTQHPSFFEKLMKTVDELKTNQVPTASLFELDCGVVQKKKIEEIAHICSLYDCFTQGLGENQRENIAKVLQVSPETLPEDLANFDPRDRLTRMADKLEKTTWGADKIFWVDGFSDFTPQQLRILENLMVQGDRMTVNLLGDEPKKIDLLTHDFSHDLFATSLLTMQQLLEKAENNSIPWEFVPIQSTFSFRAPSLAHMEAELFEQKGAAYTGTFDEEIRVHSALTLRGEVEWVAAEILHLVQHKGHRFQDILVVARDFNDYRGLLTSIFKRYEIPVFATEMVSIMDKPVISVVHFVFQTILSHLRYEDFFRYLKTGFSSLTLDEVYVLEEYALIWKIQGKEWENPFDKHPRGFHKAYTEEDKTHLAYLNDLREKVVTPILALRGGDEFATMQDFCYKLYEFLREIKLYDKIIQRQADLEVEGDLLQRDEYGQLWDILCHCLEQCHDLAGEHLLDFTEFTKVYLLALEQCSVGTIPVCLDQVMVGETTRMKSARRKSVFWLGAGERTVPKAMESGGLFTDFDRAELAKLDISLNQDSLTLFQREITTAYEIVALPWENFYLSWVSRGGEKPCFVIENILKMFPQVETSKEEAYDGAFRIMAPIPALEQTKKYPFVKELLEKKYPKQIALLEKSKEWKRGTLNDLSLELLYGKKVDFSATRLNTFLGCQFAHFMKYGLFLQGRETAEFTPIDVGNFIHGVLEDTFQGLRFKEPKLSDSEIQKIVDGVDVSGGCADLLLQQYRLARTPREIYFLNRLRNEVKYVLKNTLEEFRKGSFYFLDGEKKFFCSPKDLNIPSKGTGKIDIRLICTIDRIDGGVIEHDPASDIDGVYFRVQDYKSGINTELTIADVYYGRQIQLPLYFFVAEHLGITLFSGLKLSPDQKKLPIYGAGMNLLPSKDLSLFYPLKLPTIIDKKRDFALERSGLYLKNVDVLLAMEEVDLLKKEKTRFLPCSLEKSLMDTDKSLLNHREFGLLFEEVREQLAQVPCDLESGSVCANPYQGLKTGENPCDNCDYKHACFFEAGEQDEDFRFQYWSKKKDILEELSNKYGGTQQNQTNNGTTSP